MKDKTNQANNAHDKPSICEIKAERLSEIMNDFFSNPHNRLILGMFAVYDGDMTIKEALEFAKHG